MKMYFVRHGQKNLTAGDPGLTDHGVNQAAATARFFADKPIDVVVASPLLRTQQTALAIASALNLPVETDPRLLERANWTPGLTFEEFVAEWQKASVDREYTPPIGDSSRSAGRRIESVVASHLESGKNSEVVFVTHGGIITDFLRNIAPDEALIEHFFGTEQHLFQSTVQECSITTISLENDGSYIIETISDVSHLQ